MAKILFSDGYNKQAIVKSNSTTTKTVKRWLESNSSKILTLMPRNTVLFIFRKSRVSTACEAFDVQRNNEQDFDLLRVNALHQNSY